MVLESVIALATALLGGLIAAEVTLLALFWRMGRAAAGNGTGDESGGGASPLTPFSEQRIDDLRDYLDSKFDNVDRRFEAMQDQLDRRFDSVEGRLDAVGEEVPNQESRVDDFHED